MFNFKITRFGARADIVNENVRSRKKKQFDDDEMINPNPSVLKLDKKLRYKKVKSKSSFNIEDIRGIIYGPGASRFWIYRKHINSLDPKEIEGGLPFYSW